jgi:hypothetical protein
MNSTCSALVMSCLLAIGALATGCAASSDEPGEGGATAAVSNCNAFCTSQGGTFYVSLGQTSQSACTARRGDWYAGAACCCKCTSPGRCL